MAHPARPAPETGTHAHPHRRRRRRRHLSSPDRRSARLLRARRDRGLRRRPSPRSGRPRGRRSVLRGSGRRVQRRCGRGPVPCPRHHARAQRGGPPLRHADLRRRLRRGRGLPRHGHEPLPAEPACPVRRGRREARGRAVREGAVLDRQRAAGAVRHGRRAGPGRRVREVRGRPSLQRDRRDRHPRRRQPRRGGLRLRAVLLDLDDHRGVPQPAGHLGEGQGLVHDRAVLRGRGLRLPRRASAPSR